MSVASGNRGVARAVQRVAEDGSPEVAHVHAQLVRAARARAQGARARSAAVPAAKARSTR